MIVITRRRGRLGNRLVLYAHFIAAAEEYGLDLANPTFAEYAHLFPSTATDVWCRYPVVERRGAPSLRRRRSAARVVQIAARCLAPIGPKLSGTRVLRLERGEHCDLRGPVFREAATSGRLLLAHGWGFRSGKLVEKHRDAIRRHFALFPGKQSRVDALIEGIRRHADVIVGLHIRQGDYRKFQQGRYFYTRAQYAEAMQVVSEQLPDRRVAFVVCSDAVWRESDFPGSNVYLGTGDVIEDLGALAATDLLMGPPSTFSQFAALLGDKPLAVMETADRKIDVPALLAATGPERGC